MHSAEEPTVNSCCNLVEERGVHEDDDNKRCHTHCLKHPITTNAREGVCVPVVKRTKQIECLTSLTSFLVFNHHALACIEVLFHITSENQVRLGYWTGKCAQTTVVDNQIHDQSLYRHSLIVLTGQG